MHPHKIILHNVRRKAFSLIEFAIVMSVAGVIVAGIWVYAAQAQETIRINKAQQEITTIVQNFRAYYAGQFGVPTIGETALTQLGVANNIYPSDMLQRHNGQGNCAQPIACPDTPWGSGSGFSGPYPDNLGTFRLCHWLLQSTENWCQEAVNDPITNKPSLIPDFAILLEAVPPGSCAQLASMISGPSGPPGLIDVFINHTSMLSLGHGMPVAQGDALTYCMGSNAVTFLYKLRV